MNRVSGSGIDSDFKHGTVSEIEVNLDERLSETNAQIKTRKSLSENISREDLQKKLTAIIESKNRGLSQKYLDEFNNFLVPFKADLFPLNLRNIYPGYSTYILELGSGWGEFALEYARNHTDSLYVALDKKKYRIKKSVGEQIKGKITNVRWMVCRFEWVFNGLFEEESIDRIIINFPDPWPKTRHQKHRFVSAELIKELARIIKPGGNLEFATDNWSYMQEAITIFENGGVWKNKHGSNVLLPHLSDRPVSFFENLKRSENENIYIIQLEKF